MQVNDSLIELNDQSTVPVFFETTKYQIRFKFEQEIADYQVVHPLITVEHAFQSFEKLLQGNVNVQNNIGLFDVLIKVKLKKDGWRTLKVSFWVYPTKMDLQSDYQVMTDCLIEDDPLGMYELFALTKIERSASHKYHNDETVWYSHFLRLKEQMITNLYIIVQSPHYKFIDHPKYIRAARITKRVSNKLGERITEDFQQDMFEKKYRVNKRIKTFNTIENQFVKHGIESIVKRIEALRHRILNKIESDCKNKKTREPVQLNFIDELGRDQEEFYTFLYQPLFRQITEYPGMNFLSLVFQEKTGYAGFYRNWIQFQMMLDMWDDSNGIGIKTIDQIYERWCFLELSKCLQQILMDLSGVEQLSPEVFEDKKIHQFNVTIDGNKYELTLYHNKEYSNKSQDVFTLVEGTKQKPDITMEMKRGHERLFWLFDAKYRIDNNASEQNETPPKDAFDQMHRYRDSLFLKTKEGDKTLPILGAFVVFPGILKDGFYAKSIEKTGVGAFTMLPKMKGSEPSRVFQFLKRKISSLTKSVSQHQPEETDILYVTQAKRIPYISGSHSILQHQVLVVVSSSMMDRVPEYQEKFAKGQADFYHIKCLATRRLSETYQDVATQSQYIAVAHLDNREYHIRHVYPIKYVTIQSRAEITDEQSGLVNSRTQPDELYWCFQLEQSIPLPQVLKTSDVTGQNLYWMSISKLFSMKGLEGAFSV